MLPEYYKRPLRERAEFGILPPSGAALAARPSLLLGVILLAGCSSLHTRSEREPGEPGTRATNPSLDGPAAATVHTAGASPAESAAYRAAFDLYQAGAYEGAYARLAEFKRRFPRGPLAAQAENLAGLSLLLRKQSAGSIPHFQRALALGAGQPAFQSYVSFNLAKAQLEAGQAQAAETTARQINVETLDRENQIKTHYLRARLHAAQGRPAEAAREYLRAARVNPDPALHPILEQTLRGVSARGEVDGLAREFNDTALHDAVLFRSAQLALSQGDRGAAEPRLREIVSNHAQGPYFARAQELLRPLAGGSSSSSSSGAMAGLPPPAAGVPVSAGGDPGAPPPPVERVSVGTADSRTVGILLPLSGKYAAFGERSLQAIGLALRVFTAPGEPGAPAEGALRMAVADSGEDPAQAIAALDRLVVEQRAIAVIGPLLSKGLDRVAQRAEQLGVPLVSLARTSPPAYPAAIDAGFTNETQAWEAGQVAVKRLKMRRLAALVPRDKLGLAVLHRFWDGVEAAGGEVVAAESYTPGETDYRAVIDRLVGIGYPEARARELQELARQREEKQIKKRTRRTEQYFALPPVVDFDGVFISDDARVAGLLLPTFAYRDVDKMRFVGTSAWNSPEFPARAQGVGASSFFVDVYSPQDSSGAAKRFTEAFRSAFQSEPTAMEALAYDAGLLVEKALSTRAPDSRDAALDALRGVRGLSAATGRLTVTSAGVQRDPRVFTVRDGQITELE